MSTSNEISVGMTKKMQNKMVKRPEDCLICGKYTRFKYYNVRSCNGKICEKVQKIAKLFFKVANNSSAELWSIKFNIIAFRMENAI